MKQELAEENLKAFHGDISATNFSNNLLKRIKVAPHSIKKKALHILNEGSMYSDNFLQANLAGSFHTFLKSRVKRNDEITLVEATRKGDHTYWLSQADIADIARLEYKNYGGIPGSNAEFDVLGSIAQLRAQIDNLQTLRDKIGRITYIINLEGLHWVTLLISYENNRYQSYYIDSKNDPFPFEYQQLLLERIGAQPLNIAVGMQQTDEYNCGLWALENAADLNEMLDANQSLNWLGNKLKWPREIGYFVRRRQALSEKLRADPAWRARHLLASFVSPNILDDDGLSPKRPRLQLRQEGPSALREIFTEAFIVAFMKRLAAYHLVAKGERLTEGALKVELTGGITGALLGLGISQNIVGSIPSLVASLRALNNKYYIVNKGKAQRITKAFSTLIPGALSPILSEVAVDIFHSFESQFMQVTDKAGDRVAMEKLAEDAVDRAINYIDRYANDAISIGKTLLEQGVLSGPSEKFFDPSVKRARIRISGSTLQDKNRNSVNTANLYEKVGLVVIDDVSHLSCRFYRSKALDSNRYGYRRLLDWEKEQSGEIKASLKEDYQEVHFHQQEALFQFNSRKYDYSLGWEATPQVAKAILDKIKNRFPVVEKDRLQQTTTKDSILFNLNKPIKNFTGRVGVLRELHEMLMLGRTTAVVPALSALSIHPVDPQHLLSSGSQVSVSGLGGIGKTQLALRYAELYAYAYDHNVLWINAETKENLFYSFHKLAMKLGLETRDRYDQKKNVEDIVAEVYEYFSDRKSLFIFDNVENYRAIADYLPKSMLGNKPTLLITSRYSHWENVVSVLALNVFNEQESKELINHSLGLHINDEKASELNQLLQGLPLALQQAITYIKLRRNADAKFSLHDYIELYKQTSRELLDFDFSQYSNDPYLKTVFITWQITLDKIQSDPIVGDYLVKVLNIMAYLNPDNISSSLFNYLLNDPLVAAILNLLKSYSMINLENQENKYSIHRLVQQVTRIKLERDIVKFQEIAREIETLFVNCIPNAENNFHYMHFLLYMSEYRDVKHLFFYGETSTILFDNLSSPSLNIQYWFYFLDLAYLKFPKQKYLNFLGDAVAFCIKKPVLFFLPELLNYIENKLIARSLSKENVKYIIQYVSAIKGTVYSLSRFSRVPEKKMRQLAVIKLIYDLKLKVFGDTDLYDACASHSLKRAINLCLLSEDDNEKVLAARNQALKVHLQKIAQVSGWVSSGLLTKDTLSALLQGEFKTVAVNFGLITSSTILGKLSNAMLVQAEKLTVDEVLLLEKDLGVENKIALHLLLNENVLSAGKRRFLGRAMKVASPFVARGTTVFFVANLIDDIKKENKEGIISNGVIVSVDAAEAGIEGLEYLDFITEVSAVTGPTGEALSVLAWLGTDAYHAKQQVENIEKYVHLSRMEALIQSTRAIVHVDPSEYLLIKASNNRLVEYAISFLKAHPEITHTIFSSFRSETALHENNTVFLDRKRELVLDNDNNPDDPSEGSLFCLSGSPKNLLSEESIVAIPSFMIDSFSAFDDQTFDKIAYLCQNAIGIEYTVNRTSSISLVNLGTGDDSAIAFLDSPALFLVEGGKKNYQGSYKDDLFALMGDSSITGLLQGGHGLDTLSLRGFETKETNYLLIDIDGFFCEKNKDTALHLQLICHYSEDRLEIKGINQIVGRESQREVIYVGPDTRFVDAYGGINGDDPDSICITTSSYASPKLILRNNTRVLFFVTTETKSVDYRIPLEEAGTAVVQFSFRETNQHQHQFFFDHSIAAISEINLVNATIKLTVSNPSAKVFSLLITDPFYTTWHENRDSAGNASQFLTNIAYFFQGIEMKLVNSEQIYVQEVAEVKNQTIDEKINAFLKLANRLGKAFSIQLLTNATILIGQGKHEIFYTPVFSENYLVGNGGENVYIVLPGEQVFPLPEITLYDVSKQDLNDDLTELADTLDLRPVIKKAKQACPRIQAISPKIASIGNDLVLTLNIPFYFIADYCNCCIPLHSLWSLATIRLKNALLDNWYQKLDIFLEEIIPKNIVFTEHETWALEEVPLVFADDKQIILLTVKDIGEGAEILILKNAENFSFFRDETNLILTNVITRPVDYWTIICHQFYEIPKMREKVLSASFRFFDQVIRPHDHLEEINGAANFSEVASAPVKVMNAMERPLPNTPSRILFQQGLYHQKPRAKREVDLESPITRAANNYLKNYEIAQLKGQRSLNGKKKHRRKNKIEQSTNSMNSVKVRAENSNQNNKGISLSKRATSSYLAQNKSKSPEKPQNENLVRIIGRPFLKSERLNPKGKFYDNAGFNAKKRTFFPISFHPQQTDHIRPVLLKENMANSRLTYQNHFRSNKGNHRNSLAQVDARSDLNASLLFLQLVSRHKGNAAFPINKKVVKTINKAERQREKSQFFPREEIKIKGQGFRRK